MRISIDKITEKGNDYFEADGVFFSIREGAPSSNQLNSYLENRCASGIDCFEYCEDKKEGFFIDVNFTFSEGQIIDARL